MQPIEVHSLLRVGKGKFVRVEDAAPEEMRRRSGDSVEGAIELAVGAVPVLTSAEWDDVKDLWAYIAGMVNRLSRGEPEVSTYFPDQPIMFRLTRRARDMMDVVCEIGGSRRWAVTHEAELLTELCQGGITFFDNLERLGARAEDHRVERDVLVSCLERIHE